jgi:hypothetical protein
VTPVRLAKVTAYALMRQGLVDSDRGKRWLRQGIKIDIDPFIPCRESLVYLQLPTIRWLSVVWSDQ